MNQLPETVDKVAELITIDRSGADTLKFQGLDELVYLDTEFDWGKLVCGAEYKFRAERDPDGDLVLMEIEPTGPEE